MDRRFTEYFEEELRFIRRRGQEFADEHPKVGARLSLDGPSVDPYVERLLEGFAFLTARIRLKLDSQFPRFSNALLNVAYPHYLAPTPSIAIVQFKPDPTAVDLADGATIKRDTALQSNLAKGEQTRCEFRTAHDVTLWPIEVVEAQYISQELRVHKLPDVPGTTVKSALRLRLRATAGLTFDKIALDRLTLHLAGTDEQAMRLYELFFAAGRAVIVRPTNPNAGWHHSAPDPCIRPVGFADEQRLLPYDDRSFQGYRLLAEYFAFYRRFMFAELTGLARGISRCKAPEVDVYVLFSKERRELEGNKVAVSDFALFCTPAINLFKRTTDRVPLKDGLYEYPVYVERLRSRDYEVYRVNTVTGIGANQQERREFQSFYRLRDEAATESDTGAYFVVNREPRVISESERLRGSRSTYAGSEVYLSLVDAAAAPFSTDLRELSVTVLCTNRDLPSRMPRGAGTTDFSPASVPYCASIRCVGEPSEPREAQADAEAAWQLISHLSLNYLSLVDSDAAKGAAALRELLNIYGGKDNSSLRGQIDGVRSISTRPLNGRLPGEATVSFARGLQITLTFDEAAFVGTGCFLLGAVLDQFFARYVSINSFTKTVVVSTDRGEVIQWPARIGQRHIL